MPISIESGELFQCVSPTVKTFVLHLDRRDYTGPNSSGGEDDPRRLFILDPLPSDRLRVFIKEGTLSYTIKIGNGEEDVIETTYREFIKEEISQHLENTSYRSTQQRKDHLVKKNKSARQVKRKARLEAKRVRKAAERREKNIQKAAKARERNLAQALIWKQQRAEEEAEKKKAEKAKAEKDLQKKTRPKLTYAQKQEKRLEKIAQEKAIAQKRKDDEAKRKEDAKLSRDRGARKRLREAEQADKQKKKKR